MRGQVRCDGSECVTAEVAGHTAPVDNDLADRSKVWCPIAENSEDRLELRMSRVRERGDRRIGMHDLAFRSGSNVETTSTYESLAIP